MMIYIQGENALIPLTLDLSNYYTKEEIREVIVNIDLNPYALAADVEANKIITDAHIANTNIHITEADRVKWDGKTAIPSYSSADEGKILQIVNGVPTWVALPVAEEATF